ncbi:mitochondrial fission factor-like isoform X3 [Gadus chalcogrammus]|uniref:mitochondrial fission factor-like isoform X3 n=1 Tax=Gadus chalcogrammus TaxID=1042646 RepID=UPI0024C47B57|nr:mitochondrial fission factor-like isoform X3 [Gadus chalcogrammus]
MASFSPYLAEAMHVPGRDRGFSESINHNMQVPDRLAVGGGQPSARGREEEAESRRRSKEPPVSYNMHIPDRLTYTEAPDLSPRPQFTSSKPANSTPLTLETCWEHQTYREGEFFHGEPLHSPMRRSYSDQGLGRTPPGTPTHLKHVGALHVHLASPFNYPETPARVRPAAEASGPVNKGVSRKRATESWSQDDEGGAVVEFIVLRRQVLKMSRRLAGLERQNTERRNTEALLFSLLLSACLLNGWLWIRR